MSASAQASDQPTISALIPARAASRRIPAKNLAPFFGHPLVAYSITSALKADAFLEVLVSTDGTEIAEVARHYGAKVIDRPPELASDHASTAEAALHALDTLAASGREPEILCVLLPTCPMRGPSAIAQHVRGFLDAGRTFQLSITEFVAGYPDWAMSLGPGGSISPRFGEFWNDRSQDLPHSVCPSGAIWLARAQSLRAQRSFYGDPLHGERLPVLEAFDIDEEWELELARFLVAGARLEGKDLLVEIETPPWPGCG